MHPPTPTADRRPFGRRRARCSRRDRIALQFAGWQVIRLGGWTAGSGRCGWPRPAQPRPVPAGLGTSGSTASGSSPRMPYGPVTRFGCAAKDVNASWSSSRSSPSVSAQPLRPRAMSITALPLRPARRLSRWLPGPGVRAVRPNASAGVSRSCSGGRPAEPGARQGPAAAPGRCPRLRHGAPALSRRGRAVPRVLLSAEPWSAANHCCGRVIPVGLRCRPVRATGRNDAATCVVAAEAECARPILYHRCVVHCWHGAAGGNRADQRVS